MDASLNNYVALHYESRHMSWLHCMWGIGASIGPYVMGYALTGGYGWNMGYRLIAVFQAVLTVILIISLPLWKGDSKNCGSGKPVEHGTGAPLSLKEIVFIPGAGEVMITFFCYCALEQTTSLWASSYLVLKQGLSEEMAAGFAGLFFAGITIGRFVSGFFTMKWNDTQMIRLGMGVILAGFYRAAAVWQVYGTFWSAPCGSGMCPNLSVHDPCDTCKLWKGQIAGDNWCADGGCLSGNLFYAADLWHDSQRGSYFAAAGLSVSDFDGDARDA